MMRDESTRLEWLNCELCDEEYTWFRVWVMAAVELYGWLHRIEGDCPRDKGLAMSDMRFSAE